MRVSTVQANLIWEDKSVNLAHFEQMILPLSGNTDVIFLPEMFSTGFSMSPEKLAETMTGTTVSWMSEQAAALQSVICGSVIIEENDAYFNRLIWAQPDGQLHHYDKRHLFTLAGEHKAYQSGTKKLIIEYLGWKICPMVCYDLRFPVWSRNVEGYDLLVYVANWPHTRSHHWKSLSMARAIENQCYLVAVNRVGKDANGLHYQGDTSVIDYAGKILHTAVDIENVTTIALSKEKLNNFRNKLNFLADRDTYEVVI